MAGLDIRSYKSFAKINLFLHILNKREDEYHNLQSWFTFLDLHDELTFSFNDSGQINISSNLSIASKEDNLIYKAIKKFEQTYRVQCSGVDVDVVKNIPMGAGLGGGSSNAAVTLMAMRDHYLPELSNQEMIPLGTELGADVPIFLYGKSAWAEGVGEILHPKDFKSKYALLIKPDIHISTKEFFESQMLIMRDKLLSKDSDLDLETMHNDFESVFFAKYPDFAKELRSVDGRFRMTGTGSCFYLLDDDKEKLQQLARKIDKSLDKWLVKTVNYAH